MVDERYTSDDITDEIDDESGSSTSWTTGTLPLGLPSWKDSGTKPDDYGDQPRNDPTGRAPADETSAGRTSGQTGDGGGWAEEGLATLLLVAGVALFLFPEPATSAVGILLVTTGVVLWLVDWFK